MKAKKRRKLKGAAGCRMLFLACGLSLGLSGLQAPFLSYGNQKGIWELTENGKHWQYTYGPGEPAMDEWIEENGKEYYLDKNGYMKTGWVTDEDGNRCFLGEDGAKCKNMFLPDGKYVGPDGTVLTGFDTWRKELKKELTGLIREQAGGVFCLIDINGDGYRDLVAMDSAEAPSKVYLAAVWNEAEGKLFLSCESSLKEAGRSYFSWNESSHSAWLITESRDGLERDYFAMEEEGTSYFEQMYRFEAKQDDWGDLVYYIDGEEAEKAEWEEQMAEARSASGEAGGYFLPVSYGAAVYTLDAASVTAALDQAPGEDELLLWQP